MLIISRKNNNIHYSYETPPKSQTPTDVNRLCLLPIPQIDSNSMYDVSLKKWYIVHQDVIHRIIDIYIETFYEFINNNPRYNVYFDEDKFCDSMIRSLYKSSQSKKKHFI